MTTYDAIRHVTGPMVASAPAPAPVPRKGDAGVLLGLGALIAFGAWLIQGSKDRPDPGEVLDELDELDTPESTTVHVVETTGYEARCSAAVPPAPVPIEVRRFAEAAAWGPALNIPPPSWALDRELWNRAAVAMRPRWSDTPRPWAAVTHVYHAMGGRLS